MVRLLLAARHTLLFVLVVGNVLGLSPCIHAPRTCRGEDLSATTALGRMAASIEAARNQFESFRASGTLSIQTRVIQGTAGSAGRGEPSNSDATYSIEFLCHDFGLYRRLICVPETGASKAYDFSTRLAITPNHVLDADDLSRGYVRPVQLDDHQPGDFLLAFWVPDQPVENMAVTSESAQQWTLQPIGERRLRLRNVWEGIKTILDIAEDTSLPLLYESTLNQDVLERHEWVWSRLENDLYYPSRVQRQLRLVYAPEAVEVQSLDIRFDSVEPLQAVGDDEFGFAGLGLKPGTNVFDMRDPAEPRYEFQPSSGAVDGLVKITPPPGAIPVGMGDTGRWGRWIIVFNVVFGLFLVGLYVRSTRTSRSH